MRVTHLAVAAFLALPLAVTTASAGPGPAPLPLSISSVLPAPAEAIPGREGFDLTPDTVITAGGPAVAIAEQLAAAWRPATGFPLPVVEDATNNAIKISLDGRLDGEAYRLGVDRDRVELTAGTPAGLFNGVQTLRQLVPAEIESRKIQKGPWTIPGGRINDRPRFAYRGAMLDLARHFHTPDEVKRYIDQISRFKINFLHLHLSDDQGWRIQIDSWPRLTSIGGAPGTGVRGTGGGFLTKAEYREIVEFAAQRYVTIVPEIDMPGHVNAAQVAYPELTCDAVAPRPRIDIRVGYSSLCAGKEITYRFAEDVIRELAAMTPGPFLHIGGDEAHSTPHADYLTFQERVLPMVGKYGKTAIGWQEIAAAKQPNAIVQYWNHQAPPLETTGRVIMSPADRAYLDMQYDLLTPGGLHWAGTTEVRDSYSWDPDQLLSRVPKELVFGVEAPLWSETLTDLAEIEFLAFPRLVAIAELGWSPRSTHDWNSFKARLGAYGPRWTRQGVHFYSSPQIPWS
ncbi:hexosaminidase [Actinoplanes lutulentus]|uniref:beta-N-acetylhexosaminidase n=1 Tax=Actinoplanes lutulentus TaxID=1287878 RepID=A0A327YZR5_9ACTN|nr:beta-N-acetylhexosaminidase [Actinoplanes lutulentus]MBB2945648.1 hexosaminidase [Actinoplanes lutulentus]RAK27245.1 hexosaminidase [Actinoplanes lutulentus]